MNKVSLPVKSVVEDYNNSTPDNFKFTIKISNSITLTHFYQKSKKNPLVPNPYFLDPELFDTFLNSISQLKGKIGSLIFQFEYLNKQKMNSQIEFMERFENFLTKIDDSYKYSLEIRNPNYLNTNYFNFLSAKNLSHVFLEGYYMPPIIKTFDKHKDMIKHDVIIRLHGSDRQGMEEKTGKDWSKIVAPKDSELEDIRQIIGFFQSKKVNIFVNVNNHYEGSAPLTIAKIKELLKTK